MNDTMAHRDKIDLLGFTQPVAGFLRRRRKVRHFFGGIGLVDQRFPVGPCRPQPRPSADTVHLTFDEAIEFAVRAGSEYLKLEAR